MSYYSYGTTNIAFSTFDIWANNVSSDTNAGIDNALSDWYPTQSAPYQVSTLLGADCFYGGAATNDGAKGKVSMTSPYSIGDSNSFTVKNFDLGAYTLTFVANDVYPYNFHSWRTANNGGGSQLTTSTTLTITTATTQLTTYYAYFV